MDVWGQPGFVAKKYFQLPPLQHHFVDAWLLYNEGTYGWHQCFLQAIHDGVSDVNTSIEAHTPCEASATGFIHQTVELLLTEDPIVYLDALKKYLQTNHFKDQTNPGQINGELFHRHSSDHSLTSAFRNASHSQKATPHVWLAAEHHIEDAEDGSNHSRAVSCTCQGSNCGGQRLPCIVDCSGQIR